MQGGRLIAMGDHWQLLSRRPLPIIIPPNRNTEPKVSAKFRADCWMAYLIGLTIGKMDVGLASAIYDCSQEQSRMPTRIIFWRCRFAGRWVEEPELPITNYARFGDIDILALLSAN
ncbi:hypothetical protein FB480_1192 [Agrobacterium vitis]|nr:hypothetical protein FB480_1192 [Agrobacterium vitis]